MVSINMEPMRYEVSLKAGLIERLRVFLKLISFRERFTVTFVFKEIKEVQ